MTLRLLSAPCVLLLALGCGVAEPGPPEGPAGSQASPLAGPVIVRTVTGDDWTVPAWSPHPQSGFYGAGPTVLNDVATIMMPMIPWSAMHTGDGQYDWSRLDAQEWSEFVDEMVVTHDGTFQPLIQHAHVDGQLENWYGPNKTPDVTTTDARLLRYAIRLSLLRGLADQYSFIWLDGDDIDFVEQEYPGLVHYAQKVLGRRPSGSPDALVTLGNWPYTTSITTKAWPRWLTPLNLGATGNGVPVDVSGLGFFPDLPQHLGRTVGTTLDLAVDNRFLAPGGPHDVEVRVLYLDNGARWHLDYDSTTGVRSAPSVVGTGSGLWKTVTVQFPDAAFSGRLAGGADLRVVRESGTVTVQLIRVGK